MATLDTTGVVAVKFFGAVTQTLGGKTLAHAIGDIIALESGTAAITLSTTDNVGCMTSTRVVNSSSGNGGYVLPIFVLNEIRTPVL